MIAARICASARWMAFLFVAGCGGGEAEPAVDDSPPVAFTNRVPVPPAVRQNLGITFVRVEERAVAQTLRIAGHFTAPPSARRPHHTPLAGVVRAHVAPLDPVKEGQLLASISSPAMLELRHTLHIAEDAIGAARDELTILKAQVAEAKGALADLEARNARLKAARAPRADLRARAAQQARSVGVLEARRDAGRHALTRARHRFEAELLAFSLTLGRPLAEVRKHWESQEAIELRAAHAGVVSDVPVSPGAWVDAGALVVEVRDPATVWFSGRILNADVGRIKDGQRVKVFASSRSTAPGGPSAEGTLRLGVSGDTVGQTVPAYVVLDVPAPAWARAGTTAFAEATITGGGAPELAIPVGALVRDGLQDVFFRRDPADPDKVIRVEADRGASDGRWAVVFSGVAAGDEVVVDGAYELKLASTAKPNVTGHFHADGTFHAGDK